MITFYTRSTGKWTVIVCPAHSTLMSACNDIHLHITTSNNQRRVVYAVLQAICALIGDCFQVQDNGQPPVLQEHEARCKCTQRTVVVPVVRHLGVRGVESATSDRTTLHRESDAARHSEVHGILPVLTKIEKTLEVIANHYHPETATPDDSKHGGQTSGPPGPTARNPERVASLPDGIVFTKDVASGDSHPETLAPVGLSFLSPASRAPSLIEDVQHPAAKVDLFPGAPTRERTVSQPEDPEARMRELVREEIGRVLAGAMSSLGAPVGGGVPGGT